VLTHHILSSHSALTAEARARRRIAGREAIRRRLVRPPAAPHRPRLEAIRHLAQAIDRDLETAGHVERVGEYCTLMAHALGEPSGAIATASLLHDVGKVAVPDAILLKPGTLDDHERAEMQQHAAIGHWILSGTGDELLELAATIRTGSAETRSLWQAVSRRSPTSSMPSRATASTAGHSESRPRSR
jgi:HD-GYP domain-containing protein (c-di-GMP phosphodiesterase class II)